MAMNCCCNLRGTSPSILSSSLRATVMHSTSSTTLVLPPAPWLSSLSSSFIGSVGRRLQRRPGPAAAATASIRSYRTLPMVMMPEGPEVRTFGDSLRSIVLGKRLVDIQFLSGRYVRHGKPNGFESFAKTMTPTFQPHTSRPESIDIIQQCIVKGKFLSIVLDDGRHVQQQQHQQQQQKEQQQRNQVTTNTKRTTGASKESNPQQLSKGKEEENSIENDFQRSIWITFGMTGQFVREDVHQEDPKFARWYMEVADVSSSPATTKGKQANTNKNTKVYFHDQRNFGTLKFCLSKQELESKLQDQLGPDIMEVSKSELIDVVQKEIQTNRNPNICVFLMNQAKVSGIGNYLLAEGLYRASIDPFASMSELSMDQWSNLFQQLQSVALESYDAQGLTRQKGGTYRTLDGSRGSFEFQLHCYGREACIKGNPVIQEPNGPHKRTIWYTEEQLFRPRSERHVENVDMERTTLPDQATTTQAAVERSGRKRRQPGQSQLDATTNDDNSHYSAADTLRASLIDPTWHDALSDILHSKTFEDLATFVQSERQFYDVYPPPGDVFAALNACSLENVKVVIVGQDPYHGPNQGHGLAFSVRHGIRPPPSLKNIIQEVMEDCGGIDDEAPTSGNLQHWADQGVLLLNTVLTVRRGEANSHAKKGWEDVTDAIIRILNDQRNGLVFLLWGNPAAHKARNVDESKHAIIRSSHPSPLSARKTNQPFIGSRCFSRANVLLKEMNPNQDQIDWSLR